MEVCTNTSSKEVEFYRNVSPKASEVLRIERQLEEARGKLTAIRQAKYKLRGGDTSGDDTDGYDSHHYDSHNYDTSTQSPYGSKSVTQNTSYAETYSQLESPEKVNSLERNKKKNNILLGEVNALDSAVYGGTNSYSQNTGYNSQNYTSFVDNAPKFGSAPSNTYQYSPPTSQYSPPTSHFSTSATQQYNTSNTQQYATSPQYQPAASPHYQPTSSPQYQPTSSPQQYPTSGPQYPTSSPQYVTSTPPQYGTSSFKPQATEYNSSYHSSQYTTDSHRYCPTTNVTAKPFSTATNTSPKPFGQNQLGGTFKYDQTSSFSSTDQYSSPTVPKPPDSFAVKQFDSNVQKVPSVNASDPYGDGFRTSEYSTNTTKIPGGYRTDSYKRETYQSSSKPVESFGSTTEKFFTSSPSEKLQFSPIKNGSGSGSDFQSSFSSNVEIINEPPTVVKDNNSLEQKMLQKSVRQQVIEKKTVTTSKSSKQESSTKNFRFE